ncbi:MAG: DUF1015 domain-containing protein [Acidobacteriota bacterium]
MATLIPFRGLLYDTARVPALDAVIAPPYDVISATLSDDLRARDPHNVIHIDLPEGHVPEKYTVAARRLARWVDEGILVRDDRPSIYVVSQRYSLPGMPARVRWGFICLLRIEEEATGIVLPHEKIMDAPRADRMELTAATRAQVSPIFVLYADPAGGMSRLVEETGKRPADNRAVDDAGVETRLWRLADPALTGRVLQGLKSHKLWIADGHHRYAAARCLRDRWRSRTPCAAGPRSYDYQMAYVSNIDAPGLSVLPYHRVLRGIPAQESAALAEKLESHFEVERFLFDAPAHRAEQIRHLLREAARAGRPAIGLYAGGGEFSLLLWKQAEAGASPLAELPEPLRRLDVEVLHHAILEPLLGVSEDVSRGGARLRYTPEIEQAVTWVDGSTDQLAFLLNAPDHAHMQAVAEAGLRMPQKSTFFYPKVPTGLVIHPLDPVEDVAQGDGISGEQ